MSSTRGKAVIGAIIGFAVTFVVLRWGYWLLPLGLQSILETAAITPAVLITLPAMLLSGFRLNPQYLIVSSSVIWGLAGGLLALGRPRILHSLSRRSKLAILFIGVLIAPVFLFVTWFFLGAIGTFGGPRLGSLLAPSMASISQHTEIRFPANTRLVYSDYSHFQDTLMRARLEMDREDALRLTQSLGGRTSSTDRLGFFQYGDYYPDWDPESVMQFISVHRSTQRGNLSLLVSLDDPRRSDVYLVWVD